MKQGVLFENTDDLLKRKNPHDSGTAQIVVPEPFRPGLLALMHYFVLTGRPGQKNVLRSATALLLAGHGSGRHGYRPEPPLMRSK